jgi:hypothetical protein
VSALNCRSGDSVTLLSRGPMRLSAQT